MELGRRTVVLEGKASEGEGVELAMIEYDNDGSSVELLAPIILTSLVWPESIQHFASRRIRALEPPEALVSFPAIGFRATWRGL